MQPKNIMLLGFVNKAVEFLDQNIEDETNRKLANLKHIDLVKIRKELSDNLDASLGIVQSTMTSLMNAGEDAFSDFLESDDDRETLTQQIAKEFDFDFEEEKDDRKDLDELLTFYNLDKRFEVEESLEEEVPVEEVKEEEPVEIALEESEDTTVELDDESLELMKLIQDNVTKASNGTLKDYRVNDDIEDEINEIFNEIELNEVNNYELEEFFNSIDNEINTDTEVIENNHEIPANEELGEELLDEVTNSSSFDDSVIQETAEEVSEVVEETTFVPAEQLNEEAVVEVKEEEPVETIVETVEEPVEEIPTEEIPTEEIPVEALVEAVEEVAVEEPKEEIPCEVLVEYVENDTQAELSSITSDLIKELRARMIKEDEEIALQKQLELQNSQNESEIANTDEEKEETEVLDEVTDEELAETSDDDLDTPNEESVEEEIQEDKSYLEGLLDDLKSQMIKEDEERELELQQKNEAYAQIEESYPYLDRGFVVAAYDLKEEIANEAQLDENVIVLHRIKFSDVEKLRQFAEIVISHDYHINADENKMIVDVFKNFVNKDGKILANIFEIANQAAVLEGNYEGYRIIENERR